MHKSVEMEGRLAVAQNQGDGRGWGMEIDGNNYSVSLLWKETFVNLDLGDGCTTLNILEPLHCTL